MFLSSLPISFAHFENKAAKEKKEAKYDVNRRMIIFINISGVKK